MAYMIKERTSNNHKAKLLVVLFMLLNFYVLIKCVKRFNIGIFAT